ncbi:NAD(P)/FAD-dependent oxidoreductase [Nocardia sp. NPDC059246]|uniref:NAD(P)/FAD-dependent oxidoreductase n=1 Tax=unclassified Nocardia TaxID=2637762 RepID=UPI0036737B71
MTQRLDRIAIVGASVAGATAAETLRRRGFDGVISLIGDEKHLPYDRPPLSKQILTGGWDASRITFRDHAALDDLGVDLWLGSRAKALNLNEHTVALDDGVHVTYDGLIIATGIVPRRLSTGHELAGVHVLRNVEDALRLRADMRPGARLVVIGAGFLGCEVAAAGRQAGLEVCIVDPLPVPMARQLGDDIGRHVANLHREHGVDFRCGFPVRRLLGHGSVTGVELATGVVLDADVVLVAIGSTPATDWLANSGLRLDDGVVCDATCRAAPDVYAAGDVARWWHETLGTHVRVEHRMNATEQAIAAATNLLGANTPFKPVPYFWTDQYDTKIQAYGSFSSNSNVAIVHGDPDENRFIAHYVDDNRITGVLAWNMPKKLRSECVNLGQPAMGVSV